MKTLKRMNAVIGLTALVWMSTPPQIQAAPSPLPPPLNDILLVTDALGDDMFAMLGSLLDPRGRARIKAILVTSGNAPLKAANLRQLLAGLALDIPVIVGSSSDLGNDPVTAFASDYGASTEGEHLLPANELMILRAGYAQALTRAQDPTDVIHELRNFVSTYRTTRGLDVVAIGPITDLEAFIGREPNLSAGAFGDVTLGMAYRRSPDGNHRASYNSRTTAGVSAMIRFLAREQSDAHVFRHVFHLATDTVRTQSGLTEGLFPAHLQNQLVALMTDPNTNPLLPRILRAGVQYVSSWMSHSNREIGTGLNPKTSWLSDTYLTHPTGVAVYLGDYLSIQLALLNPVELATLPRQLVHLKLPEGIPDLAGPVVFTQETVASPDTASHPLVEIMGFPGPAAVDQLLTNLASARTIKPTGELAQARTLGFLSFLPIEHGQLSSEEAHYHNRSLVITFKNSPDDWYALAWVLSTSLGRTALARGGVVVEGFQAALVAEAVRAALWYLGSEAPVAVGRTYKPEDVAHIPNLKGEQAMADLHQYVRAFGPLVQLHRAWIASHLPMTPPVPTVLELTQRIFSDALASQRPIDWLNLGEGLDFFEAWKGLPAEQIGLLRNSYIMGGARKDGSDWVFTRNWLRDPQGIAAMFRALSAQAQGRVHLFSSHIFSGSNVGVNMERDSTGVPIRSKLGTAFPLVEAFLGAHGREGGVFIHALDKHWEHWTRVFAYVMSKPQPGTAKPPFDENAVVTVRTFSPIGVAMGFAATSWEHNGYQSQAMSVGRLFNEKPMFFEVLPTTANPSELTFDLMSVEPSQIGLPLSFTMAQAIQQGIADFSREAGVQRSRVEKFARAAQALDASVRKDGPFAPTSQEALSDCERAASNTTASTQPPLDPPKP